MKKFLAFPLLVLLLLSISMDGATAGDCKQFIPITEDCTYDLCFHRCYDKFGSQMNKSYCTEQESSCTCVVFC
ncbi:hypothetical protein QJS10_CPB15g01641 [Acorus calamus]|uniref:Uncharacterized protein n=1 Tax=Acorus calamus TaxID=4465 RepID=A0AAV9D797_ACOCL|nr:hypothetical protein QJS10_CPB15g01641 [Acorus calamus]